MMNQARRQIYILEQIKINGEVKTKDLSEKFNVSTMTISRDLKELAKNGAIELIHGGAIPSEIRSYEYSMAIKEEANVESKRLIARHCKSLVNPGYSVFIETGTTALAVAKEIFRVKGCTFYTNSLLALNALSKYEDIDLHAVPGKYRDMSKGFVGLQTVDYVKDFRFDLVFVGTEGIDINNGITLPNEEDAYTKKAIIEQAKQVVLVADSSKFGLTHRYKACEIDKLDLIVTDVGSGDSNFMGLSRLTNVISIAG